MTCIQWGPESFVTLRAQNGVPPSDPLGGGDAIILKVICIVLIHPHLPKGFIFSSHNSYSKNSTAYVRVRGVGGEHSLSPNSSTTVDLLMLFLELRMDRMTGIIEAVIPWRQDRLRGTHNWPNHADALPIHLSAVHHGGVSWRRLHM